MYFYKCRCGFCLDVRECVSVSAENLEKSLRQMERQLQQLERDLETFASPDDPNDMFLTKMAISFTHACIWLQVWGIVLWVYCGNTILKNKIKYFLWYWQNKKAPCQLNFKSAHNTHNPRSVFSSSR